MKGVRGHYGSGETIRVRQQRQGKAWNPWISRLSHRPNNQVTPNHAFGLFARESQNRRSHGINTRLDGRLGRRRELTGVQRGQRFSGSFTLFYLVRRDRTQPKEANRNFVL